MIVRATSAEEGDQDPANATRKRTQKRRKRDGPSPESVADQDRDPEIDEEDQDQDQDRESEENEVSGCFEERSFPISWFTFLFCSSGFLVHHEKKSSSICSCGGNVQGHCMHISRICLAKRSC